MIPVTHPEHGRLAELMPLYAADTLDPSSRDLVRAHIQRCPACRGDLAAWEAISAASRILAQEAPDPSPRVMEQVLAATNSSSLAAPQAPRVTAGLRTLGGRRLPRRISLRVSSALAAVLLLLAALLGYRELTSPAPVSAQTVLLRAAAIHLPADSAEHLTFRVSVYSGAANRSTVATPNVGRADLWIESDASGEVIDSAQTLILAKKHFFSSFVQSGATTYSYDPEGKGGNSIAISPESRYDPIWLVPNHMFDGAAVARTLTAPNQQGVQLLPQQTIDGHVVDVVQVDGGDRPALRTTLYYDARTYVLRGFDTSGLDSSYPLPEWQVRLTSATTIPASDAPPHAFTLNAPADATIQLPGPDFSGFAAAFQSECHTTLNLKAVLGSGQAPLSVCRRDNPAVTEMQLLEALIAPTQHDLEVARAAGQITVTQEQWALSDLWAELTTLVTTQRARE
jgi:hypothetical protein